MINRDDMLELTRRMTPARASIDRIAGAYFDEEGYVDGTFNTHFLKLSASEKAKNLELAKTVLISKTNEQLREYRIPEEKRKPVKGTDKAWQEGSEEVYEYLICAVSPLEGEYEPGVPERGFLYPAFKDRSTAGEYINLYEKDAGHSESVWQKLLK